MAMANNSEKKQRKKRNQSLAKNKCSNILCNEVSAEVISCDDCSLKFHFSCCDMDEDLFNMLSSTNVNGLTWAWRCISCSTKFSESTQKNDLNIISQEIRNEVKQLFTSMDGRLNDLENKCLPNMTSQITKEVEHQSNDVRSHITSYVSTVKKNIDNSSKVNSLVSNNLQKMNNQLTQKLNTDEEAKDVKLKERNLCLFNIPESPSDDMQTESLEDLNKIKTLLMEKADLKKGDIVNFKRAGSTKPTAEEKPRPIIITLSDMSKRLEILKLRDLTFSDDASDMNIKIYVSPDRTPKQRELHRNLRKKIKERKELGESDLVIRNYKIVKIQPFRFRPDEHW